MKTKKTGLILLSVLLIAGIIGSVYYFKISKADDPKEQPTVNAEEANEAEVGTLQNNQAENIDKGLSGIEDVGGNTASDVEENIENNVDTPTPEAPKVEPPKVEPPKVEPPKVEPKPQPKPETPKPPPEPEIPDWDDPSMLLPGQNITPGGARGDKGAVRLP